ncbi:hypothetical protein AZA_59061 [Nitrospirillum viridazoti Y2]|nr:hypothetical protein AZA_59061 [Nitrospirillum amazonense Y2]
MVRRHKKWGLKTVWTLPDAPRRHQFRDPLAAQPGYARHADLNPAPRLNAARRRARTRWWLWRSPNNVE